MRGIRLQTNLDLITMNLKLLKDDLGKAQQNQLAQLGEIKMLRAEVEALKLPPKKKSK